MGYKLKFKMYNKKTNQIVDDINRSIAVADGTVQSFDRQGNLEGTAANTHLIPYKEKREVPLYSETAIDTIIGNIYQNADLKVLVM